LAARSTELGGGGTATANTINIAKNGIRNFLIHAGIHKGELEATSSIALDMPDDNCFVFSEHDGLIEFSLELGESVCKGDVLARVWPIDRTGIAPVEYLAKCDGVLAGRHFPGLVKCGDFLSVVAIPAEAV
jgi:N-alpha-acetyl-L-2,4-diaminobutyrate deacetylase